MQIVELLLVHAKRQCGKDCKWIAFLGTKTLHILVGHHNVVGWRLVLRVGFHVGHLPTKFLV